jgi:hypothetical protein
LALLSKDDVDFSGAKPVISAAQKFVIPVAAFADADPLVYPGGTEKAGRPITDWQGKAIGEKGIIFYNEISRCWQAAPSDGRSVVIINEVTADQALALEEFARDLGQSIDELSKSSLERLLAHARSDLGLVDMYNSSDDFIRSKMTPVGDGGADHGTRPWGLMKRDDRDICEAVFVTGPAHFQGPAVTAQEIPADGAFIVRQDTSYRMVDKAAMLRTYMNADGSPLDLRDFSHAH